MSARVLSVALAAWLGTAIVINSNRDAFTDGATNPTATLQVALQQPKGEAKAQAIEQNRVRGYSGAASCGSGGGVTCHGQRQGSELSQSFTLWFEGHRGDPARPADPHRRAYESLFKENGAGFQIVSHLSPDDATSPEKYRAFLAKHCNSCHATPELQDDTMSTFPFGVSCVSCHGPAEGWFVKHRLESWEQLSNQDKDKTGFKRLKDISIRASVCVRCHVGTADAEVNHELIAVGHPRLNFDFRTFFQALPEHWNRAEDETRVASASKLSFQLTAWQAGRRAELLAALELLEGRAARAAPSNWPEFSEYSCYACHHDLSQGQFRVDLKRSTNGLGEPDWGSWHSVYSELFSANIQRDFLALGQKMNQPGLLSYEPRDADEIAQLCRRLKNELQNANAVPVSEQRLRELLEREEFNLMDWDRAKRWRSAWLAYTPDGQKDAAFEDEMEGRFFRDPEASGLMKDAEYGFGNQNKQSQNLELRYQSPRHFDPTEFEDLRQKIIRATRPN